MASNRHLIVKLAAIGDVVMALAGVKAFKETRGGEIDWLCGRGVAPLLGLYSFVDRVIGVDDEALLGPSTARSAGELLRVWRMVAGRRYRTCATLHRDWRYRLLTLAVVAERRVGLSGRNRAGRLLPGRYHGDEYARVLLGEDGLRPDRVAPPRPDRGRLPASPLPRGSQPRVALIPGGSRNVLRDDPLRRWPLSHYAELASALLEREWEVVLAGGPDDLWTLKAFEALAVKNLIGQLSLVESIALFDACDLVISHDTGPFHLAMLTSAAILGLFGPTDPRSRVPDIPRVRVVWGGEHLACRPCYDGKNYAPCLDNRCLKEVSPARVLGVIDEMLGAAAAAQNGTIRLSQVGGS